jgi:hypothetical protein
MKLSRGLESLFKRLNTPQKIQDYLESIPFNFETGGETYMSPRRTAEAGKAHCFEGALLAAAALAYHGQKPLIMDIQTTPNDDEHVVALFTAEGHWGAVSKTNHGILRYRDPVYKTVRELAMSYFHEYMLEENGEKTMRAYSAPFNLSKYPSDKWLTADEELFWLVDALDASKHYPVAPAKNLRQLRKGTPLERANLRYTEWKKTGRRSY